MLFRSKNKLASAMTALALLFVGTVATAAPAMADAVGDATSVTNNNNGTFTCVWNTYTLSTNTASVEDCNQQFLAATDLVANAESYRQIGASTSETINSDLTLNYSYNTFVIHTNAAPETVFTTDASLNTVLVDTLAAIDAATPTVPVFTAEQGAANGAFRGASDGALLKPATTDFTATFANNCLDSEMNAVACGAAYEDAYIEAYNTAYAATYTPVEPPVANPTGYCFIAEGTTEAVCEDYPVSSWLTQTTSTFPAPSTEVPSGFACSGGCYSSESSVTPAIQKPSLVVDNGINENVSFIYSSAVSPAKTPLTVTVPLNLSNTFNNGWTNFKVLGSETVTTSAADLYAGETSTLNEVVPTGTFVSTATENVPENIAANTDATVGLQVTFPEATFTRTSTDVFGTHLNAFGYNAVVRTFVSASNADGVNYILAMDTAISYTTEHGYDIEKFAFDDSCAASGGTICAASGSYPIMSAFTFTTVGTSTTPVVTPPADPTYVPTRGVCTITGDKVVDGKLVVSARLDVFGEDKGTEIAYDLPTELASVSLTDNIAKTTEKQEPWTLVTNDWVQTVQADAPVISYGISDPYTGDTRYFTGVSEDFTFANTKVDANGNRDLTFAFGVVMRGGGEGYIMDVPCTLASVVTEPPVVEPPVVEPPTVIPPTVEPPVVTPVAPPVDLPKVLAHTGANIFGVLISTMVLIAAGFALAFYKKREEQELEANLVKTD